jgi:DUF1365 family protein
MFIATAVVTCSRPTPAPSSSTSRRSSTWWARYDFYIAEPGQRLALIIRESEHGEPLLIVSHAGKRLPLTDRAILHCLRMDLFMTLKVFLGIHIEALRLWPKGAALFTREASAAPADVGGMR